MFNTIQKKTNHFKHFQNIHIKLITFLKNQRHTFIKWIVNHCGDALGRDLVRYPAILGVTAKDTCGMDLSWLLTAQAVA